MASSHAPSIVVLALGAGTLGGPDTLRLVLDFAGRNPVLDIAICILAMAMAAAYLLGALRLALFIRHPQAAGAANVFDRVTLAASLVTACLVAVPLASAAGAGSALLLLPVAVLVAGAAAAAAVPGARRALVRMFRAAGNAGVASRVGTAETHLISGWGRPLAAAGIALVVSFIVARGANNALRLVPGSNGTFVRVAAFTLLGAPLLLLLLHFSRRTGSNATPVPAATATVAVAERGGKLTRVTADAPPPQHEPERAYCP